MRCHTRRRRVLLAAFLAGSLFSTAPSSWALSCADIPGGKIDPDLDSMFPGQGFGRLIPEFRTEERTRTERQSVIIDRQVAKIYLLENGGRVIVSRHPDERIGAVLVRSGRTIQGRPVDNFPGIESRRLDTRNAAFSDAWNVALNGIAVPQASDIDSALLAVSGNGRVKVAEKAQSLTAPPGQEESETNQFSCSSDAQYAGEPARLSKFVVVKGTVKAVSTTTRTTINRIVDLTVTDYAWVETLSAVALASQLTMFPEIASELLVLPDIQPAAEPKSNPSAETADQPVEGAPRESRRVSVGEPTPKGGLAQSPEGPGGLQTGKWPQFLSALAGLTAVLLVLLFVPQAGFRRRSSSGRRQGKGHRYESRGAAVTAQIANDNADGTAVRFDTFGDVPAALADTDKASALNRRIDLLERLSRDADGIHKQVGEALDTVMRDAHELRSSSARTIDLKRARDELVAVNGELEDRLAASARELTASRSLVLDLKLEVADLKVRLAKSDALAQSTRSIIDDLQSASDTAVSLTSEYKDELAKLRTEVVELRGALACQDDVSQGRDELLESTLKTNEELEAALRREREQRQDLSNRLCRLHSERMSLERAASKGTGELKAALRLASDDLRKSEENKVGIERQLQIAAAERRKVEEDLRIERRNNVRQRMDFEVKVKLLEHNVQALTVYVSEIEQLLERHGISIPAHLSLAPGRQEKKQRSSMQHDAENIVNFRAASRDSG